MLLPFALWGSSMVAMKMVLPHADPWTVACLRILPAALAMLIAMPACGVSLVIPRQDWGWLALFAVVDVSVAQGLLAEGLQRTGAGIGSVLIDTQPLLVALMARSLFREAINPVGWLGLCLGLAGVVCLGLSMVGLPLRHLWWPGTTLVDALHGNDGVLLMLGTAVAMAVGTVLCRLTSDRSHPLSLTAWHLLFGGLPLLAVATVSGSSIAALADLDWWLMGYVSLGGTAVGYGLFFWFATHCELTGFCSLTFLTPVFAVACSTLLHEHLSPFQWLGIAVTLAGVLLIGNRHRLWIPAKDSGS